MKFIPMVKLKAGLNGRKLEPGEYTEVHEEKVVAVPMKGGCHEFVNGEKVECLFARLDGKYCEHVNCGEIIYLAIQEAVTLRLQGHDFAHMAQNESPEERRNRRVAAEKEYRLRKARP